VIDGYQEEANDILARPDFQEAKEAYIALVLPARQELGRTGKLPAKGDLKAINAAHTRMQEASGIPAYKKAWKLVSDAIVAEVEERGV
jgi:hypothetical protein